MKKKILFVTTELNKGGAEIALINLLEQLPVNEYDIDLLITKGDSKTGISLISMVPKNVNMFVANKERVSSFKKLKSKFLYRSESISDVGIDSLEFVRKKDYDLAISYGEWFYPEFIVTEVTARIKAVWIHTDISKPGYIDHDRFFSSFRSIDWYIFVSKNSMEEGIAKFPFIKDKSIVIHNITNDDFIKSSSNEIVDDFEFNSVPWVVTVANVRDEKNHERAIDVFIRLRQKGLYFKWLNIGAISNPSLYERLDQKLKFNNLEQDFLFIGARQNPYKYLKKATVVAVLSNYESWSLAITEAKILNKPIIATKTSGALEQLVHNQSGYLVDFETGNIADGLEDLMLNNEMRSKFSRNLDGFGSNVNILKEFSKLFLVPIGHSEISSKETDKTLFIIDNINYQGGAHVASVRAIKELKEVGVKISIFSQEKPNIEIMSDLTDIKYLSWEDVPANNLFKVRLLSVFLSSEYKLEYKILKLRMTLHSIFKGNNRSFQRYVLPKVEEVFKDFDCVCTVSEASVFREQVSKLPEHIKKVQWIHTDYVGWSQHNEWTKDVTIKDREIYSSFNKILFVSDSSKSGFNIMYPELKEKAEVLRNIMPVDEIKTKSKVRSTRLVRIVTIGRLESEKGYERILKVGKMLAEEGMNFRWKIVGDGWLRNHLKSMIVEYNLENYFEIIGYRSNPYPFIIESDLFALLSYYEGLPNTIYESLILGTPVIATRVGGIPEQIDHEVTGWLVNNSEKEIFNGLMYLLLNEEKIDEMKQNLTNYEYDNKAIISTMRNVFENNTEKQDRPTMDENILGNDIKVI